MVSLWGSKKDSEDVSTETSTEPQHDRPTSSGSHQRQNPPRQPYDEEEPDERSHLLPRQPHPQRPRRDGYLDPDDPAVSPDNLWTVRLCRYASVLFFIITFLWWVLLLVSIFVSPPGMHNRGSGFFDFSYTTLTAGNLMVALLFFLTPSRAMRVVAAVMSGVLLVDMIIILAVSRIRAEEGWVGIASVIWATVIAIWCVVVDRVVAWGKREEEERLTGRPETRRTLAEWLSVTLATIILSIFTLITILMTATLILRARDASLAAPGEKYYVDGTKYQVHVACFGNKTRPNGKVNPTVLLEAGEEPAQRSLAPWLETTYTNGTISRYCWWDRPGYGWSDNAPSPHSAGMSARALAEALARAGEDGPYVLVSAGFGSIVSRIFSSNHGPEVAGIMMVDPLHEDLLHRLSSPGRGFALWGYGILSPLGIQRLAGALFQGRTREDRVYGRSAYQGGKFIKAQLQENLVADSLTKNEVMAARSIQRTYDETPLVVVSSGIEVRKDDEWEQKQKDLTTITKNLLEWVVVPKAEHEVWKTDKGQREMERGLKLLMQNA